MRKLAFVLGLFAALCAIPAAAQPSTLPANTVYGRLGIGSGPGQAIPFSILASNLFSRCLSMSQFGSVGDGVTDNTAAFNAAVAALPGTNGCIEFPAGKFRFNSAISYTLPNSLASIAIKGQGADNTILFWPNASGGLTINYTNALNTAHIWDLSLTTGQAGGGTGLAFTSTAHTQGISDIYRVTLRGDDGINVTDYWNIGVFSHYVSNLNVEGLAVFGQGATGAGTLHGLGMQIEGAPAVPDYAVQVNVAKSVFEFLGTGILYGSYLQGLTVDQSNFSLVGNGIQSNSSETGVLAGLAVTNSQFGLFNNSGVGILTLTTIINTQITNNFFDLNASGTNSVAIWLSSFNHFNIIGNSIGAVATTNGLDGILLGTATNGGSGVISGNDIFLFQTGINLGASATGVLVSGNTLEGNTTAIANAGTGNTIAGNPGFNPNIILAGVSGKTLTIDNSLELAGTDGTKMTFPAANDNVVGTAATQTLTNKTLTSPTIASISGNSSATGTLSTGTNGGTGGQLTLNGSTSGSGVIGVSSTGTPQYGGTATNDNAPAGNIGEYQTASASSISLTSGTTVNITSKSLTAGDWEITGVIIITPAGTTPLTGVIGLASLTTASLTPLEAGNFLQLNGTLGTGQGQTLPLPATRLSISATTTVFVNVNAAFTVSTATGGAILRARRVR